MFGRIHQWTHLGLVLPPFQLAREVWEESIVILYMFGGIHHDSISLHVWWNSAAKASGPVLCFIGRFLIIDSISFFVSYNFYWLKFILSDIERVTCSSLVTVCMVSFSYPFTFNLFVSLNQSVSVKNSTWYSLAFSFSLTVSIFRGFQSLHI